MAEYKDEGILDKILTLVAPPLPPSSQKGRGGGRKAKSSSLAAASATNLPTPVPASSARHSGMQNHPYCDACGDGGNLLCCDTCPASFHFNCCDPPIDPKNIPSGDWLCRHCGAQPVGEEVPVLYRPLVDSATASNPRIFCIPYELQRRDILPGSSRKELKQARLYHHGDQETREHCKYCYACNTNSNHGRMVSCDFCPLVFHLDCLHPPLTIPPTTVWMCPVHPNTKIPGSDHPRLSQRLKALERSHADIPFHTIKTDFIKQLRRIPHYKRITSHHNRRVTEVPSAIKSLYNCPLPDVSHVLAVSDSLLTSSEDVLRWRQEEERERKQLATPRPPTLTHNQDEWTRRTVLDQLYTNSIPNSSNDVVNSAPRSPSSLSVLVAAQQLLELSAARDLTTTACSGTREEGIKPNSKPNSPREEGVKLESPGEDGFKLDSAHTVNGFIRPHSHTLKNNRVCSGLVNGDHMGMLCSVDEEEEERDYEEKVLSRVDRIKDISATDNSLPSPTLPALIETTTPQSLEEGGSEKTEDYMDTEDREGVPDLSQLDPKVVQFLALQRLQQLFSSPPHKGEGCETSPDQAKPDNRLGSAPADRLGAEVNSQTQLFLNGWTRSQAQKPRKKGPLHTAPALLCPLSGTSTPLPLHKQVTSVGIGLQMDLCLSEYGHCNYISSRQACIFYDKATQDYELINYSEHGTVVDGVLYSCDFSNKPCVDQSDVALTLDDLSSLGKGRRASRAKARLEAARKSLKDKQEAKRALEAALQLSAPIKDDFSLAEELSKCEGLMTRTGLKRVAATDNVTGSSVVLSIPLSKTKKSDTSIKKGAAKRSSPAKLKQETTPKAVEVREEKISPPSTKQEPKLESNQNKTHLNRNKAQPNVVESAPRVSAATTEEEGSSEDDTEWMDTGQVSLGSEVVVHSVLCGCSKSPSSVVGASGKGWEGTATLYHGSRLRFGCLQFVLSFAGQSGHSELLQALDDQLGSERDDV